MDEMEYILNGSAFGSVAQILLRANMDVGVLRPYLEEDEGDGAEKAWMTVNNQNRIVANATLRKDEWKLLDTAILAEARNRLVAVADLIGRGLTFDIANGLGTTVLQYEAENDFDDAQVSMDGLTQGLADATEYDLRNLPLPIIHKDFHLGARHLAASRNLGQPLDTTNAEKAARKVAEMQETLLVTGGSNLQFGGGTIYGYLDFPQRNTVSLTDTWDSSATAVEIVADVKNLKQALINDRFYGPYVLYIPTAYETVMDSDYSTSTNTVTTIRERILQIENVDAVRVLDTLTANNVLLVQMTSDVVRWVRGLGVSPVEWPEQGGMRIKYKVMSISVPQLRYDFGGRSGIAHLS